MTPTAFWIILVIIFVTAFAMAWLDSHEENL